MRTRLIFSSSNPVPSKHRPSTQLGVSRESRHKAVLLHEAVDALDVGIDDIVVDATLGAAGHAKAITQNLGREGLFIGFDLDSDAVNRAEVALAGVRCKRFLINANFRDLKNELEKREISRIDKALFDLGWSSDQLDAGRGFSFLKDEPLTMTYRTSTDGAQLTAATIVNEWSEESLADIIYGWGEERYSRRIAKAIIFRRSEKPFTTSSELATVIQEATPLEYRRRRIHPATKTFQALRIAVNDELGALDQGLRAAWEMLAPGGRIAVITFHSIEDKLVKRLFLEFEKSAGGYRVNKKPIVATHEETQDNPRARSAKLRVIQKI